ncbi:MAG: hypothetical protein MUF06_03660 [Pirellulaceae bacterium]|jgi:hypothetical protein|nr:hypothetical protein [Pirellulaceae bacterium]
MGDCRLISLVSSGSCWTWHRQPYRSEAAALADLIDQHVQAQRESEGQIRAVPLAA